MNGLANVLAGVEKAAQEYSKITSDDVLGDDGLYICSVCGAPKQYRTELLGEKRIVSVPCECLKRAEREKAALFEETERKKRIEAEKRKCFFQPALRKCTFDCDDGANKGVFGTAQRYAENFPLFLKEGVGLLFFGGVGVGKTYAAACIANAVIEQGYSVLMTSFARIANSIPAKSEERQEYFDSVNANDLLIIDDLAAERRTEYMLEIVTYVIDSRCQSGKPIIVTTNMTREEIISPADISNKRICDRLLSVCQPLELTGVSRRKAQTRRNYEKFKDILGIS